MDCESSFKADVKRIRKDGWELAMKVLSAHEKTVILGNTSADEAQKTLLFNMMKAQVIRSRVTMTAVFLSVATSDQKPELTEDLEDRLDAYVIQKIRQTDVFLSIGRFQRCLLLSHTGEAEANAFLKRLFMDIQQEVEGADKRLFGVCLAEVNHRNVSYGELVEAGVEGLQQSEQDGTVYTIRAYEQRESEKVKVSIVENDEILSNALCASLKNLSFPHFELEIRQFYDGFEFLESDFVLSGHSHLVIADVILPRTNGLKVVHSLRQMPNQKKFTIFMMTKRKSESDMLYAYEAGVDQYLIKPFNIRLFEAQIKRTFERFWS